MAQRRKKASAGEEGKTEMEYYVNFMVKHTPKLYISLSSSKKNKKIPSDDKKGFK
jgi:hypothetical protein